MIVSKNKIKNGGLLNKASLKFSLSHETGSLALVLNILKKYRFGKKVFNIVARRLRKHFKIACIKAGIADFRFHDLRACFCTNALLNGWSIAEVSTVSGHKDWSQLKRYTRIKPADLLDKINKVNVVKLIG